MEGDSFHISVMVAYILIIFSRQGLLEQKRYHTAVGSIVEATLVRIVEDITALPDIPAVESHRLSELCRILNALEGLFGSVNQITDPVTTPVCSAFVSSLIHDFRYRRLSRLMFQAG